MKPVPKEIKAQDDTVSILWIDGHASVYTGRQLRLACRCAACVDEWSHESLIQEDQVPAHVKPLKIDVVGSYALHFTWDDGHSTGIYSYDHLREVCECPACRAARAS